MVKLSLFTPTHKPTHLDEAYESLLRQNEKVDFEWIIVPNNGVVLNDISEKIRNDKRVKITFCSAEQNLLGVGALKKFACDNCTGDVFIELDHDDKLTPDTFNEIAKAHSYAPEGFYYSDFINIKPDGSCETYGSQFGWKTYQCTIEDKNYTACSSFSPSARSICQIFYAPNHIRAWSRKSYELTGGHDPAIFVGDDHDLICRTYLAGVEFVHIAKPIYIYRRWDLNSYIVYNDKVQTQQNDNCNKYIHPLIIEETRRRNLIKVDVGRTKWAQEDFESVDLIEKGFYNSISANSVGCLRAVDFFQRVPRELMSVCMNTFYQMLAPGGWIVSSTPSIVGPNEEIGRGAFQDPNHVSFWSPNNFWYFTKRGYADLLSEYYGKFQEVRNWVNYPNDWHQRNHIPYVHADLCALKGQNQPGLCEI